MIDGFRLKAHVDVTVVGEVLRETSSWNWTALSDKKPDADPEVSQMGHLISTLLFSEN